MNAIRSMTPKTMTRLGVALIIVAFVVLLGVFAKPEVLTPLTPLYCHAGETLTSHTFTFSLPGETSISFSFGCADAAGTADPRRV